MSFLRDLNQALKISESHGLIRRYFVVNGFDGALTMLGILSGFYLGGIDDTQVVISACLGAAIALFMSGLSAAYISEAAERKKALAEIEQAMAKDLSRSSHGIAARWSPWVVGAVNGLAPFLIALVILLPILIYREDYFYPPLQTSILFGLLVMFLLGTFLGKVSGSSRMVSGLKAILVGLVTLVLVLFIER